MKLQELLHHAELAEFPVDAPRVRQRFAQGWIQLEGVLEMLQRFDALKKLRMQDAPQAEVQVRLDGGVLSARDGLLDRFGEARPIVMTLEVVQSLL